eukprot:2767145-Prymnesium_polylepis.1
MHRESVICTHTARWQRRLCTAAAHAAPWTGDTASVPRSPRRLTRLTRAQSLTVDRHTGPARAPAAYRCT